MFGCRSAMLVILTVAPALASGCRNAPAPQAAVPEAVFNGEDLNGWQIENGGRFSVRDGVLVLDGGRGWLRSIEEFTDFRLEFDFRFLEPKANSGIFVRTGPTSHSDANGWPDNGYQVQCMDTLEGEHPLATMIDYGAPLLNAHSDLEMLKEVYRPIGQWHTYDIRCVGEELRVVLNGGLITTATLKNLRGHIGIQGEDGKLEFRNFRLTKL